MNKLIDGVLRHCKSIGDCVNKKPNIKMLPRIKYLNRSSF